MNIYSLPIAVDREPAKPSARDNGERETKGQAFDAAVKNAGPAKQPGRDAAAKAEDGTDAAAKAESSVAGKWGPDAADTDAGPLAELEAAKEKVATEVSEGTDSDKSTGADATLQSLLGMLVSKTNDLETKDANDGEKPAKPPTSDMLPDESEAIDGVATGKGLRVDVLKMETHFEPHQNGMVLVQPDVEPTGDELLLAAELGARSQPVGDRRNVGALVGKDKAPSEVASAVDDGSGEAAIPMRFDEALARLTRGQSREGDNASARDDKRRDVMATDKGVKTDAKSTGAVSLAGVEKVSIVPATGGELGLSQQIAGRMLEVLGEPSAAPASYAAPSNEAHLRMRAGGGVLKTLTIQLKPEHLGTLDVSMRLSEGRLTVELAASQGDTAVLLTQDRSTLRNLLERAGFSVDDAAITVVTRDIQANAPTSTDASAQDGNGPRNGAGSGGSSTFAGDGARKEEGGGERRPSQQDRQGPSASSEAPSRRVGSTYL